MSCVDEHRQSHGNARREKIMQHETLIPQVAVVTDIREETPDVKTFRVVGTDGKKLFE